MRRLTMIGVGRRHPLGLRTMRGLVIVAAVATVATVLGSTAAAGADTAITAPFSVNFQAQSSVAPAGYVGDYGQAYDATRGYGWVDGSGSPLSIVGNGRERGVATDKRLDTFVHAQLPAGSPGVSTPAAWKATIANGTYLVTVGVGDPSYFDSHHVVRVEGQTVIDFTPTATQPNEINSITVGVSDGALNIDAIGGTNTKLDFVQIQPASSSQPYVTAVQPGNGATNVTLDTALTVQLSNGADPVTANASGVQLIDAAGKQVGGFYNTDGAYSNVTFVPSANLSPNAIYTVKVTSALHDPQGNPYQAFTSTFTTGTAVAQQPSPVGFTKTVFDAGDGTNGTNKTAGPTAMALGPDNRLYVAFGTGSILSYALDANGNKTGTPVEITAFKFQRTIAGLGFDPASTSGNLTLWVSNGQFGCDLAVTGVACDDFTGAVSKLTGANAGSLVRTDVVTGLPRSVGNHMNNGFAFGPDGAMYLAQGANNGFGAPDAIWGNRSEDPLSAAILRIAYKSITSFPYNVNTSTGYNPAAAGALVKTYATGTRNPFSVLWHSNGKLYAPVNESANGNTPADPAGGAPALNDLPAFNDYFTEVVAGKYYGHPNPARGEYRLNGGNPTSGIDPFEVPQYPVGTTPNTNWRKPDMDMGLHRSPDGSVEFKSNVFGGTLKGEILVTEYSQGKDIVSIKLDSTGKPVSRTVVMSGFNNPLPITSDPVSGRIYVGEYGRDPDGVGGQIDVLTPIASGSTAVAHVNFQAQTATTPTGYTSDYGAAFDTTQGFGWEDLTGAPLSRVGLGRERNLAADKRLDTLMHMQAPSGSGMTTPGRWELVVPNGTYSLTVGVGDPGYIDSHDVLNAEGSKIVDFTPTSGTPQTVVTATVTVADGRLTIDPAGGTNTKIAFIDVMSSGSSTDVTPPTVTVTPSGTKDASGNYLGSADVTIAASDDAGGSGIASVTYTVDGGASQTYVAPFTVSSPGSHTVVATAKDRAGNTASRSATFTVVSGTPAPVTLTTPDDVLGLGTRLVFSTVASEARTGKSVTIRNTTSSPLSVTSLTISGADGYEFKLDPSQPTSFTVPANGTAGVLVNFRPTDTKVVDNRASLTIGFSTGSTATVALSGLNALNYEGDSEPNLQQIFAVLGYSTNAGVTGTLAKNSISNLRTPAGDEVVSGYWKRADASAPMQLTPVGHYSGRATWNAGPIDWYPKGSPGSLNHLFMMPGGSDPSGGQNQRLMPGMTSGSITSFSTSSVFGIHDEYGDYSDDGLASAKLHDLRFYPAKAADGTLLPNTWLVADDVGQDPNPASGKNWDYQDYVLLLRNAQPEFAAGPPPGATSLNLGFGAGTPGTVLDRNGLGTGFTSVQANAAGNQYQPGQLTLNTSTGRLEIVTTGGTNTNTTNNQQNALQSVFDATLRKFQVQSRLVGPFSSINAGSEQQAIYFGYDQDNYFKLEIESQNDGKQHLTIWMEKNGVGSILTTALFSTPTASTLDLFITGDPAAGTLQAAYRVNSSAAADTVLLGAATPVPDLMSWFNRRSFAGIMANNSSGGTPFTAIYDSFAIAAL